MNVGGVNQFCWAVFNRCWYRTRAQRLGRAISSKNSCWPRQDNTCSFQIRPSALAPKYKRVSVLPAVFFQVARNCWSLAACQTSTSCLSLASCARELTHQPTDQKVKVPHLHNLSAFFLTPFVTMADPVVIAKQFVDYYYQTFDANRAGLAPLYVRLFSEDEKSRPWCRPC